MSPSLFIAWRYLFSKKSHNVINVISLISAIGMALGTAALVLIMSVYNGFNRIVEDNLSAFDPDVRLCAGSGGVDYSLSDSLFTEILDSPEVTGVRHVLEFEAFLTYGDRQAAAHILGTDGDMSLYRGDLRLAAVGAGLASELDVNVHFLDPLKIYSPDREKKISLVNPMESMRVAEVYPGRVFSVSSDIDGSTVLVPLETARELFGNDRACSSIDLTLADNSDRAVRRFIKRHSDGLGPGFAMEDRYGQHPGLFRMMRLEKAAVFLILLFVVLIVALNISGSLSMLIVEKQGDIATLRSVGADDSMIRRVFVYEGWLVSLFGMLSGLVVGLFLVLIQQHFGIIRMPGNYLIDAYPVVLRLRDVFLSLAGVSVIGLVISMLSSRNIS